MKNLTFRLISFIITVHYAESSLAACDQLAAVKDVEAYESSLAEQSFRTEAWNVLFSWGSIGYGAAQLAMSKSARGDGAGDSVMPKAMYEIGGGRSVLAGLQTYLKPLPFDRRYESVVSEQVCERRDLLESAIQANGRLQNQRPYLRLQMMNALAIGLSSFILGYNYRSWASARNDALKTFMSSQLRLYLMPSGYADWQLGRDAAMVFEPIFFARDQFGLGIHIVFAP